MNDSKTFRTLNQFAVEIPTLPVNQCFHTSSRYLKGCWGLHSYRRAAKKGRHPFGIHKVYRETFLQIHMLLHQLLILKNWIHGGQPLKSRFICLQRRKVKDQNKIEILDANLDRQPKIQSSSVEETLQRIMEQTNNDCRFHSDKFHTPATFACWKIRFKTKVCTYSQFSTEAMQWIKEVELVDSVDELRSSSSTRGISMPNFEVLDARIASALNKIIHNSQFKRRISLEEQKAQKQDSFLRGRQIAYLIYDHFWVTGSHDSVENYTLFFEMTIFRNSIQSGTEIYCPWRKSHMMKSWKDCTNKEYESLRNLRPYWNCMTWRLIRRS